jgi:hypothetical protein
MDLRVKVIKEIVEKVNNSTGLTHPNDKGRAVELIKRLRDEKGITIPLDIVRQILIEKEWSTRHIKEFLDIVKKLNDGRRIVTRGGPYWKENIFDILEVEEDKGE